MDNDQEKKVAAIITSLFRTLFASAKIELNPRLYIERKKIAELAGYTGKTPNEIEKLLKDYIIKATGIMPILRAIYSARTHPTNANTLAGAHELKQTQEYELKDIFAKRELLIQLGIRPNHFFPPKRVKMKSQQLRAARTMLEEQRKKRPPRHGR